MQQLTIESYLKSRRTDPVTSKLAAADNENSGNAASHRAACLVCVRNNPGLTAAEIAKIIGLERHEPSRRLPELRRMGLVVNGPARVCNETHKLSLTWNASNQTW